MTNLVVGVLLFTLVGASVGHAATVLVAVNGVDSDTCGAKTAPCRSINEAVERAATDDTIVVGPGRYGDLDGDGLLGEAGEEGAELGLAIFVGKRLTIVSRDGAAETVIDLGNATPGFPFVGIRIAANGVVFGKPKKGFTLTRVASGTGALIVASNTVGVHVAGNRFIDNAGTAVIVDGAEHVIEGNRAFRNAIGGFSILGNGHTIRGNLSVRHLGAGFNIDGTGHLIKGNTSASNGVGFSVHGNAHTVQGNVAVGSPAEGFFLTGEGTLVTKNSSLANGTGMLIENTTSNALTVTQNNLMGNNCGIESNNIIGGGSVLAPQNFWGAATGPGPDPADVACGVVANPFATKEFKVQPKLKPAD